MGSSANSSSEALPVITKTRDMLVYRYEFWDERRGMIRESDTFATLDAILQGLGIPLMHSGKVVPGSGIYHELVGRLTQASGMQ
jgi:hypothetical protein